MAVRATIDIESFRAILLRWPGNASLKIGVPQKFGGYSPIWERYKHYLQPSDPSVLHCRDAVCVARNEYDTLHGTASTKGCDVEPYSHVYPLLFEVGLEVFVRKRR